MMGRTICSIFMMIVGAVEGHGRLKTSLFFVFPRIFKQWRSINCSPIREMSFHTRIRQLMTKSECRGISNQESTLLWRILKEAGFIIPADIEEHNASSITSPFDVNNFHVEPIGDGYCNTVYRIDGLERSRTRIKDKQQVEPVVVKVFSPMAKFRVDPEAHGNVDVVASDLGVGPEVINTCRDGIVMKYVDGSVLTEEDIHGTNLGRFGDGQELCESIARVLVHLHLTEIPAVGDNTYHPHMLWHTLGRMISFVTSDSLHLPEKVVDAGWTIPKILHQVENMRGSLETLHLPVVWAHGDLKPSNIMASSSVSTNLVIKSAPKVCLIDFELSGLNYRGYDMCKLFRTSSKMKHTERNMHSFARSYIRESNQISNVHNTVSADSVSSLVSESKLFEPLTWLEAAIFFLFAAKGDKIHAERWANLACDRFRSYESSEIAFETNISRYRREYE